MSFVSFLLPLQKDDYIPLLLFWLLKKQLQVLNWEVMIFLPTLQSLSMHGRFREIPIGGENQRILSQRGSRIVPLISKVKISTSSHLVFDERAVLGCHSQFYLFNMLLPTFFIGLIGNCKLVKMWRTWI
ncbi:hypothetical protein PTKIN_Ptkin04bG0042100 [Pterospermum kingtungense]